MVYFHQDLGACLLVPALARLREKNEGSWSPAALAEQQEAA